MNPSVQRPANKAVVTFPSDREIHIERTFDAERGRVWRAMTDAQQLAKWWGRGNPLTVERLEVEKGGHWRFVEHSDHGQHGFEGRFGDLVAPERVTMTFEWDGMPAHPARESMRLEDLGDGRTRLVVDTIFFTTEERDGMASSGMEEGMNRSYQALDRLLAGGA
jgi:uncharacterized protein YndB with AHSA1/START domain